MKTTLLAAGAAGVLLGGATFLVAPSLAQDDSSSGQGAGAHAQHGQRHRHHGLMLRHARGVVHADWTTRNGTHHEAIRGEVTAVSDQAITVKAKDGVSETYTLTKDTKVRIVGDGHRGQDAIGDVKAGERALVVGKDDHQARRVIAVIPKSQRSGSSASPSASPS